MNQPSLGGPGRLSITSTGAAVDVSMVSDRIQSCGYSPTADSVRLETSVLKPLCTTPCELQLEPGSYDLVFEGKATQESSGSFDISSGRQGNLVLAPGNPVKSQVGSYLCVSAAALALSGVVWVGASAYDPAPRISYDDGNMRAGISGGTTVAVVRTGLSVLGLRMVVKNRTVGEYEVVEY